MGSDDSQTQDYSIDSEDAGRNYTPSQVGLYSQASGFRYEHGRTYHGYREGSYWGPNDDRMLAHEVIVHHMCLITLKDRKYLAPIHNPKRILDIGCGFGLWAMDMADVFPSAEVIGVDLSPRPSDIPPSNVEFILDDATSKWTWPENHFDFIHIRGLFGSISDWPDLYAQILHHLKPGGWLEQMEWDAKVKSDDGSLPADSVLATFSQLAIEASEMLDKPYDIAATMATSIREAGLQNVTEKVYKWPIGAWCRDEKLKELGWWNIRNWEQGMEGWTLALYTRSLGWNKAQVDAHLEQARKELHDLPSSKQHPYSDVHLVYAQKPVR